MNCALWLNKRKVLNACEIAENLDVASLRGYFLAGSLVKWLRTHGGEKYAEKLEQLSEDDERLNDKLAEIFGGKPLPVKTFGASDSEEVPEKGHEFPSGASHGSFEFISYGSGSFSYTQFTSFGIIRELFRNSGGSFGSFKFGSFYGFTEWERLFRLFSQSGGSFVYGSFGSFGSFAGFSEWEWEWLFRLFSQSYGSFGYGSFGSFPVEFLNELFGSFPLSAELSKLSALDEYDRIMLETLMKCPLDSFGYGIHNI